MKRDREIDSALFLRVINTIEVNPSCPFGSKKK